MPAALPASSPAGVPGKRRRVGRSPAGRRGQWTRCSLAAGRRPVIILVSGIRRERTGRRAAAGDAGFFADHEKGGDHDLTSVSTGVAGLVRGRSSRGPAYPSAQGDSRQCLSQALPPGCLVRSSERFCTTNWSREVTRRPRTWKPAHGVWETPCLVSTTPAGRPRRRAPSRPFLACLRQPLGSILFCPT